MRSDHNPALLPSVLFVCLGNICRSPTAEAVFRRRAREAGLEVRIDSAGTSGWHIGEPPDPRSIEHGEARGYDFGGQASRKFERNDAVEFDYVLAMDAKNLADMKAVAPPSVHHKLRLFLDFAEGLSVREVPDPYYGGPDGFDMVIDVIEAASRGLLVDIAKR